MSDFNYANALAEAARQVKRHDPAASAMLTMLADYCKLRYPAEVAAVTAPASNGKRCRHCREPLTCRVARGLCRSCWSDEDTRELYAPLSGFGGNTRIAVVLNGLKALAEQVAAFDRGLAVGIELAVATASGGDIPGVDDTCYFAYCY